MSGTMYSWLWSCGREGKTTGPSTNITRENEIGHGFEAKLRRKSHDQQTFWLFSSGYYGLSH